MWFCFNVKPSDWEEKIAWYPKVVWWFTTCNVFVVALVIKAARNCLILGFWLRLNDNEVLNGAHP